MIDETMSSLGGKARAEALTPEQRSEIAKKAAAKRWAIPRATHTGVLRIGESIAIPCANLDNGLRVVSDRSLALALGARGGGRYWEKRKAETTENPQNGAMVPEYLSGRYLKPFISDEAIAMLSQSISYKPVIGETASGVRAEALPEICDVWIKAMQNGALTKPSQIATAEKAYLLLKAFANVGIIALIDEATGYQYDRAKDALAEILEKFIAKELRAWTSTFPLDFYQQIFRLRNWPFDPDKMQKPQCVAHYTNNIVYARLAPGVLDELRKKNPVVDGRRRHKMFQWLTGEVGHPKLLAHLEGVKILMKESISWDDFQKKLNKYYPIIETTELGFEVQVLG